MAEDLYRQGDELQRITENMARSAVTGEAPKLTIVLEQSENAFRNLAETFGSLSRGAEARETANELFAVAELCRATYRQCWSARQAMSQLLGELD